MPLRSPSPAVEPAAGSASGATRAALLLAVAGTFLSAALLFLVQPLIAKALLPWFGGAPATWSACMLFFQAALLAGYGYAHLLARWLSPLAQRVAHGTLLLLAMAAFPLLPAGPRAPILPGEGWRPEASASPIGSLLILLARSVGLPFVLLSATSPLVQSWMARARPGRSPYRLYAVSNLASLAGLLLYPFLVEPSLTLPMQARAWVFAFSLFALCLLALAFLTSQPPASAAGNASGEPGGCDETKGPSGSAAVGWLVLAACPSLVLLAATNQMCQDVAAVPFLWVLPLSLYLLTLVICFEREGWYQQGVALPLLAVSVTLLGVLMGKGVDAPLWQQVGALALLVLSASYVCHGELQARKPVPARLTSFYLLAALGATVASAFVTLVAPRLFAGYWELPIGTLATVVFVLVLLEREEGSLLRRVDERLAALCLAALAAFLAGPTVGDFLVQARVGIEGIVLTGVALIAILTAGIVACRAIGMRRTAIAALILCLAIPFGHQVVEARAALHSTRSFFGVLRVLLENADDSAWSRRTLVHGAIVHGLQYQADEKRRTATTYFGRTSAPGLLLEPQGAPRRVGVIGLGAGTLAAYGRPGDHFRFYEIDRDVIALSQGERPIFTFIRDSPAEVTIAEGDARLSMERELARGEKGRFHLFVIDAFSGDAIPTHLLTREAFAIYLGHMEPNSGVIAFHISNRHLDLKPVVRDLAASYGFPTVCLEGGGKGETYWRSTWAIVPLQSGLLDVPQIRSAAVPCGAKPAGRPWTDDFTDLLGALR